MAKTATREQTKKTAPKSKAGAPAPAPGKPGANAKGGAPKPAPGLTGGKATAAPKGPAAAFATLADGRRHQSRAAAIAPKPVAVPATEKLRTKRQVCETLALMTGLTPKQMLGTFGALGALIEKDLGKKGPGVFVIPGLLKLKLVRKAATKARQGTNPFTKEPMTIKAKPARNVVRALPLKGLKDLV